MHSTINYISNVTSQSPFSPTDQEIYQLITDLDNKDITDALAFAADNVRKEVFGNKIYIRGLIEFTNYCGNNCLYCGIRKGNPNVKRYRLTKEDILKCCRVGYDLGFRTFVLQGGEDPYFTDDIMCDIINAIHTRFPDAAITLSIGERNRESYASFYHAGATRYLLRHETADCAHYSRLHPKSMRLLSRIKCLYDLKDIGYQVGSGFMVGSPYQTPKNIISDIRFLQDLNPHMIGIGPFIPHRDTPFKDYPQGEVTLTLRLLSLLRLIFPFALIPSTTALGTIDKNGREMGIKAGGNVVMPNLSPDFAKENYNLYNNKIHSGCEAAGNLSILKNKLSKAGYEIVTDRGDSPII